MKLYYARGACSLSPHIVANELGIKLDLISVDLGSKKTSDGKDFTAINPKGYVPALVLDDGRLLTEGPAIVQYLADLKPEKGLLPKAGSFERAEVQAWLTYIGTEIHKNFGPLFMPGSTDAQKDAARQRIVARLELAEKTIAKQPFLGGEHFCVADAYLFTVLQWCPHVGISMDKLPALKAYSARLATRDSVKQAVADEK